MKIWAKTEEFSEGKYLVVRRDGTTPNWPHFVIGGDDPCAPWTLRAYAAQATARGFDPAFADSIRELADEFERRTGGKADPDAGPHRVDLPEVIQMMRRQTDVVGLVKALNELSAALKQAKDALSSQDPEQPYMKAIRAALANARDLPIGRPSIYPLPQPPIDGPEDVHGNALI